MRSRHGPRVFFHPQRPARAPPADARHPGLWLGRGRRDVSGGRGAMPPEKCGPEPGIDARGGAEVLSEVEQHVDHARPHLPRRRQRSGVISVADHLSSAAEGAVDRERQPDGEPVHATSGAARLIPLDDEMPVVLLNRKMDHPKAIDRRPRDGAPERPEHTRPSEVTAARALPGSSPARQRGSILGLVTWGIDGRPRGFRPAPFRAPPQVLATASGSRICRLRPGLISRIFRCRRRRRLVAWALRLIRRMCLGRRHGFERSHRGESGARGREAFAWKI